MPRIRIGGNLSSREMLLNLSLNPLQTYKLMETRSSIPSKTNELGNRDQSGTISHLSKQKNIAPTMTARGLKPLIARPFESNGITHPTRLP